MSFNALDAFIDTKKAFLDSRGGLPSAGIMRKPGSAHTFFKLNEPVPATTWGDVFLFSNQFLAATDPPCTGYTMGVGAQCPEAAQFVHTDQYNAAKAAWLKQLPLYKAGDMGTLANKILSKEIYPYNEAFWGFGREYAAFRNAAGIVESKWSMAKRSVAEAVEELPGRLKSAANAVLPDLPDVKPWGELLKWSAVAGGLFMLYWYVLKPKKS